MRNKTVLVGRDKEVIPILIGIHSPSKNPDILDCTYNKGTMWNGVDMSGYKITTMDIDPTFNTDYIGDFRDMPFNDGAFDVIVFDPPHLPTNAASKNSSKIFEKRYGITDRVGMGRDGDNISEMFIPFLYEAKRVLKKNGIILAKIADIIHNHRYQWQQVDFVNAVKLVGGMTPCDMLIKADPSAGNLQSGRWSNVKHLRKGHCYWIVVRNSLKCEAV